MKKENKNITELVKTFEDARKLTGRPDVPDFSNLPTDMRKHFEAQYKMIVIAEALNEGWVPDVCDSSVYRWYPWFKTNGSPSSFAFRDSYYDDALANAGSGSRLCLKNKELSEYCGKQFIDLWKQFIL